MRERADALRERQLQIEHTGSPGVAVPAPQREVKVVIGNLLRVVAQPQDREALAQIIFAETSTLGMRVHTAERHVQARSFVEVETPHGKVRIKVAGDGSYAPEYEDCRRLAVSSGTALKQIIAEANYAYVKQSQ